MKHFAIKYLCFFLSFMISYFPLQAYSNKSISLNKGKKAPFSGTLLDPEAVARILSSKKTEQLRCKLKLETQKAKSSSLHTLKYTVCKNNLKLEKETGNKIIELKNKEIERLAKLSIKPKKDLVVLWFSIGVAVGVGATIGVAFAIKEVTR